MLKGNKGEWSEFYAFVKLVSDKNLYLADERMEKVSDPYFPIRTIFREETVGRSVYALKENDVVEHSRPDGTVAIVDVSDLKIKVVKILEEIKIASETFSSPTAEGLFERFGIHSLNAGNTKKEDISLEIYDHEIRKDQIVGFSIKSQLGSAATLLNASGATNLIFKISGISSEQAAVTNAIKTKSKIKDRLSALYALGGRVVFARMESAVFEKNLGKLDSGMPAIVGYLLLAYYSGRGNRFDELAQYLALMDVSTTGLGFDKSEYRYKIMQLLYASALGMMPATPWDGETRAHGGVIIVRQDGEIVHYNAHNADKFRAYLMTGTKLETPSATKHRFGSIYETDEGMFIRLNLQIRFIK